MTDDVITNPTPEQLEDALKDSVDAVGYADPAEARRQQQARIAEQAGQANVKDGTHLVARDGTRYIVSNLQHRYVPVVQYPRPGRPKTPTALDELVSVGIKSTLTLRRADVKIKGKAARREDKRIRREIREQRARLEQKQANVDWTRIDEEVRRG